MNLPKIPKSLDQSGNQNELLLNKISQESAKIAADLVRTMRTTNTNLKIFLNTMTQLFIKHLKRYRIKQTGS